MHLSCKYRPPWPSTICEYSSWYSCQLAHVIFEKIGGRNNKILIYLHKRRHTNVANVCFAWANRKRRFAKQFGVEKLLRFLGFWTIPAKMKVQSPKYFDFGFPPLYTISPIFSFNSSFCFYRFKTDVNREQKKTFALRRQNCWLSRVVIVLSALFLQAATCTGSVVPKLLYSTNRSTALSVPPWKFHVVPIGTYPCS